MHFMSHLYSQHCVNELRVYSMNFPLYPFTLRPGVFTLWIAFHIHSICSHPLQFHQNVKVCKPCHIHILKRRLFLASSTNTCTYADVFTVLAIEMCICHWARTQKSGVLGGNVAKGFSESVERRQSINTEKRVCVIFIFLIPHFHVYSVRSHFCS